MLPGAHVEEQCEPVLAAERHELRERVSMGGVRLGESHPYDVVIERQKRQNVCQGA